MNLTEILEVSGIVLGSGGIGSFITWLLHLKAEKRLKESEVKKSEQNAESLSIANDRDKFELMTELLTKMILEYNELSDEYRAYRKAALLKERNFLKKIDDKCSELALLKAQIQYLKGLRCYDTTCPHRIKTNPEKLNNVHTETSLSD